MKSIIVSFLCLSFLVALSSAFFRKPVRERTPDEYVEALITRWSRPPRNLIVHNQNAMEWLFKRLMERDIQDSDRQIPQLIRWLISATIQLADRDFDEWFTHDRQNQLDIRRMLIEFDNLKWDQNSDHCGMRWMQDTFGTLDYLYGLSTRLLRAKEAARLPFFEQEDMPKLGVELYKFLIESIRVKVRYCVGHLPALYGGYFESEDYQLRAEKHFDAKLKLSSIRCPSCFSSIEFRYRKKMKEAVQRAKSIDTFDNDELWSTANHCLILFEIVDNFISTYNLATIFVPEELTKPEIQTVINDDHFKKLNEYNRLCCRFLAINSPLAAREVHGQRRFIGIPGELRRFRVDPFWSDHRNTEADDKEDVIEKQAAFYRSRGTERRSQLREEDMPDRKPDDWWHSLTLAQQARLGFISLDMSELHQFQEKFRLPIGEID